MDLPSAADNTIGTTVQSSTTEQDELSQRLARLRQVWLNHVIRRKKIKVHIFWEGHKILRNLHLTFDCMYCSQKLGEDFVKFWEYMDFNICLHFARQDGQDGKNQKSHNKWPKYQKPNDENMGWTNLLIKTSISK